MRYADLHMHTIYSDGTQTPDSLVRNAALKGLTAIAITDHDTMGGIREACEEAQKWGLELVNGVEVSTKPYHILGLGIKPGKIGFELFLGKIRDIQLKITRRRIEQLQKVGMPITLEKVVEKFRREQARIGKYNVFMAMLMDEECREYFGEHNKGMLPQEIFGHYFGKGGVASDIKYPDEVMPREAIEQIHKAGGIAIIAHPFKEVKRMEELDELRAYGLDGLEVQPNFGEVNGPFEEYALEHGMIITKGSDYHGGAFITRPMLTPENALEVEESTGEYLEGQRCQM